MDESTDCPVCQAIHLAMEELAEGASLSDALVKVFWAGYDLGKAEAEIFSMN